MCVDMCIDMCIEIPPRKTRLQTCIALSVAYKPG